MSLVAVLTERGLQLDPSLAAAAADAAAAAGGADGLADALEAVCGGGRVTAGDLAKVRAQLAKKASRDPMRTGGGTGGAAGYGGATSPALGPRFDKSTIHVR